MNIHSPMKIILSLICFCIVIGMLVTFQLSGLLQNVDKLANIRYQSYQTADELRQSSDDLTRLGRTYVVTGDEKYKKMFMDVLDIRNGDKPRPKNYHTIYWDLVLEYGQQPKPNGESISLQKRMKNHGFTEKEFSFLKEAQNNSDQLINMEVRAMNAVKGLFPDNNGNYTINGKPDMAFAAQLLHSKEYHIEKSKIMEPIESFFSQLETRTANQFTDAYNRVKNTVLIGNIVLAIMFIVAILGYGSQYKKVLDKVYAEMKISAAAKREIEATHKKMTDSINYALLIQDSIIPEDKVFKNYFSDYFAIWKPRDVIGGDVYLFTEFKDRDQCLLMMIDCTGHGVPGAFVTMLVKAIERQVVGKINQDSSIEISPGWILGYFNKTIKKLLHQEELKSTCNAGFDGGILLYDRKKSLVKYAGAELPLFIIQDGVMKTIEGNRQSVGYRRCELDFHYKENNIKIDRDSYLYLATDGYIDQNGGDNDFPFGKKRFKDILLKIHQENFVTQKEILLQKNIEYQIQEESTDDVTIVGLKIEQKHLYKPT